MSSFDIDPALAEPGMMTRYVAPMSSVRLGSVYLRAAIPLVALAALIALWAHAPPHAAAVVVYRVAAFGLLASTAILAMAWTRIDANAEGIRLRRLGQRDLIPLAAIVSLHGDGSRIVLELDRTVYRRDRLVLRRKAYPSRDPDGAYAPDPRDCAIVELTMQIEELVAAYRSKVAQEPRPEPTTYRG